ncbi:hypothetical protein ColTof4_03564 [Colletotrichum tofieldiae]|nr:hypothetical protein ColTof3_13013 [Colletotrichum tofieldiae]GKT71141.1 hypothetical protein ColTof4_03564 [Colletotrichum tofieldiae]GKT93948.1 hypothetical protein Ct61P_11798 [Colletotrichum tofieldiae]
MPSHTEFTLGSLIEGIRAATGASYAQAFQLVYRDLNGLAQRARNTGQVFAGNRAVPPGIVPDNQMAHAANNPGPAADPNCVPDRGVIGVGVAAAPVPDLAAGANAGRPAKRYSCHLCPGGSKSYTRMYSLNQHKKQAHHIPMPRSEGYRVRHGLVDEASGSDNASSNNVEGQQQQAGGATVNDDGNDNNEGQKKEVREKKDN